MSEPIGYSTTAVAACHASAVLLAGLATFWVAGFQGGASFDLQKPDAVFNCHPLFMIIGFVIVFGEGILAYRLLPLSRPARKLAHLIINGMAMLLALVGVWAVFKFHSLKSIPDLYSLHSWCGMSVLVLFAFQWLFGLYAFFYPTTSLAARQAFMPWHTFLGVFLFCFTLATASQGVLEKMTFRFAGGIDKRGTESIVANMLGLMIFAFGAIVIWTATVVDKARNDDGYRVLQ
ncbi:hypothetical protein CLOM_g3428 [Closterium sp. NIES-68]|nr:hypothetical protein CLOM_g3428 [Closterium sp. NIES-68]GJP65733.1 hypothetical protein CLOP_g22596 [Closterium sp. NIES-67]